MSGSSGWFGGSRDLNVGLVLSLIRSGQAVTRAELQLKAGLSKASVAAIVAELLGQGLVWEPSRIQIGRGRSTGVLALNPAVCAVVGVQIGDETLKTILTDLNGQPQDSIQQPLNLTDPAGVIAAAEAQIAVQIEKSAAPVLGIGIGAPGAIDREGTITVAVSHGWREVAIGAQIARATGLPTVVANRAKVAALGLTASDQRFAGQDIVYLHLGEGIAAGIVIDGQLVQGCNGGAGELGHVTIEPDGGLCECGNQGCLHTIASTGAILARARAAARSDGDSLLARYADGRIEAITIATLALAAEQGDELAVQTLDTSVQALGIAIANLVNTLNPAAVVIGGPLAQLGSQLTNPLTAFVRRRALGGAVAGLEITTVVDDHGAAGAAALWLRRELSELAGVSRLLQSPRMSRR